MHLILSNSTMRSCKRALRRPLICALGLLLCVASAHGQESLGPISVKTDAEVEMRTTENGREVVKLAPADQVVPGDQVIYTLEVRNTAVSPVRSPTVDYAIPEHMVFVADTAVGPGAEVSYSVDGGRTFERPESLRALGVDGRPRVALAAEYTHIRWQLKNSLKGNSVAFLRFRAVVK
jgi:uncharacterized repeat protein (TIGR01451 family)